MFSSGASHLGHYLILLIVPFIFNEKVFNNEASIQMRTKTGAVEESKYRRLKWRSAHDEPL